jgi:hypothetical protein
VTLLHFTGCPNWQEADARVRQALLEVGLADDVLPLRPGGDPEQAELRLGGTQLPPSTTDMKPTALALLASVTVRHAEATLDSPTLRHRPSVIRTMRSRTVAWQPTVQTSLLLLWTRAGRRAAPCGYLRRDHGQKVLTAW